MRAGYTMFLISPRNVPAAVADMLRKTECRHLLLSPDDPAQELARRALEEVDGVSLHDVPTFDQLFPAGAPVGEPEAEDLPSTFDMNGLSMIAHSSGEFGLNVCLHR